MILILSHERDYHTQMVVHELNELGHESYIMNLSRFPETARISLNYGDEEGMLYSDLNQGEVDLAKCGAVWWRRPQPFGIARQVTNPIHRMFATNEAAEVFGGLWGLIDAQWINEPRLDDLAHRKVYQLKVAKKVGLRIPDTSITNSPDAARQFLQKPHGEESVYKAFSGSEKAWRETRLVGSQELQNIEMVQIAPVIFQEYVPGDDIRVTVVGEKIFPACIDSSGGDYPVDFRMNYDAIKISTTRIPDDVRSAIHHLMKELGLIYGAIDFKRTRDGNYVFLEINPAGQWLFIEHQTGQGITNAIAQKLIAFDRHTEAELMV